MSGPILSAKHFELFGRIICLYADLETNLRYLCSAMLRVDPLYFLILSEPYTALTLRNVVKSLANTLPFEREGERDKIIGFAGDLKAASTFRNYIADHRWKEGQRPNSIKPMYLDIRSGQAIPWGIDPEEADYTIQDIVGINNKLESARTQFHKFCDEYGYTAFILEMMPDDNNATDSEDGIS